MDFRQLHPEPRHATVDELLDQLGPDDRAPTDRPYVLVNFVSSVDGRATVGGRSGGLSSEGDRAMFHGLRERVDAVLVGTGTVGTERYGRMIKEPQRRRARAERGLAPEPLAALVTRAAHLPPDVPLWAEPEARIVAFGPPELRVQGAASIDVVHLDQAEMTLTTAVRRLRRDYGIRLLLCEGGPTLFGALLLEGIVDELFLTISPMLAGGGRGPTITSGPGLADPDILGLKWVLEREESLFLRYRLP